MWSPDRRRLLRLGALALGASALAGCGFRPMYGRGEAVADLYGAIAYRTPEGRLGWMLRETLQRRLGRPGEAPTHALEADIKLADTGLAITEDSAITRYVVRGVSRWTLTGPPGFKPLSGEVKSVSAYSATGSLFATRAARRGAEERVVRDLGERLATRVAGRLAAAGA